MWVAEGEIDRLEDASLALLLGRESAARTAVRSQIEGIAYTSPAEIAGLVNSAGPVRSAVDARIDSLAYTTPGQIGALVGTAGPVQTAVDARVVEMTTHPTELAVVSASGTGQSIGTNGDTTYPLFSITDRWLLDDDTGVLVGRSASALQVAESGIYTLSFDFSCGTTSSTGRTRLWAGWSIGGTSADWRGTAHMDVPSGRANVTSTVEGIHLTAGQMVVPMIRVWPDVGRNFYTDNHALTAARVRLHNPGRPAA